jgi:hypothetical protein
MTKRQNNSAETKASARSRKAVLIFDNLRTAGEDGVTRVKQRSVAWMSLVLEW